MEPQLCHWGCATGPAAGSCEGWRGAQPSPKLQPPAVFRGLCRVSWQAGAAVQEGLFLASSVPCYQGPAVGGRKEGRQGPRQGGTGLVPAPMGHRSIEELRREGIHKDQGPHTPAICALTHTHISSNSAFNPFSYKTSNTRPKISLKKTEMMGREHCRQDEAGSQSSAQAGEPSRTQRWLKNP